MKIIISKSNFEKMYRHALAERPDEACGLVAGRVREDDVREIQAVYLLTNTDHAREHFSLDPKEQLLAVKDMRKNGQTPLGNWHSHPETPARPSREDIRLAHDSGAVYLILSLAEEGKPVLNGFRIEGPQGEKTVRKAEVIITD